MLNTAKDLVVQLLELFLPSDLFPPALGVLEATDHDALGRVNGKIPRIYCIVTRGIGLLSVVDFDTCITQGIGQLVVLGLRLLFVYLCASFNCCPRKVVYWDKLVVRRWA